MMVEVRVGARPHVLPQALLSTHPRLEKTMDALKREQCLQGEARARPHLPALHDRLNSCNQREKSSSIRACRWRRRARHPHLHTSPRCRDP